jgi:hypothetical protein
MKDTLPKLLEYRQKKKEEKERGDSDIEVL